MNTATPPNGGPYLIWSIVITTLSVLTLCFCFPIIALPPGIAGIVFATRVNAKLGMGDTIGAEQAAKNAKLFCIIATVLFVLAFVAYFVFLALGVGTQYLEEVRRQMPR
ncbi:MAG: CD225/dispanin family protein [Xanthomonadaceae bacterium]|nr:CD225/dispanin family protein [Xanthomonadaceae bacterium]